MTQLKKHLNVSTLLSCIALFVALGGAAYAAGTLTKKSVKTQHLANGSVTTPKLRNGSVTPAKLRNGAVTNPKLRNGAVTGAKIAPATIGSGQLANGSVRSGQLGGQVVTEPKIKDGAVSESKLASGAVTSGKLAPTFLAQLVRNVSYVTKTSPGGGNLQTATAECPAGKQVVGGGAKAIPGGAETAGLTESYPFLGADGKRTGWTATVMREGADGGVISVEAYAICAEL